MRNFLAVSVLLNILYPDFAFIAELKINNAQELINFAKKVNAGTTYSGYTVYLNTGIEFTSALSQQFPMIGNFLGIFNGQGHTISNLKLSASAPNLGLFGYSTGLTIQNLVIDSFCSITNTGSRSGLRYTGGFIGCCDSNAKLCSIENSVNMADVSFTGSTGNDVAVGGFAGRIYYGALFRNCANYGTVTNSGSGSPIHIGGLVGDFDHNSRNVINCFNYGKIKNSVAVANRVWVGGLIGEIREGTVAVTNCANSGTFTYTQSDSVGNIVGAGAANNTIHHCFGLTTLIAWSPPGQVHRLQPCQKHP